MSEIDAYIAPFPPEVRARLEAVRQAIREEAPDAVECISYAIPTFDLAGTHLIHFAGYARHIGLYPTRKPMIVFADAFSRYKTATGSVQFPLNKPLPLELIREVTRFRIAELRAKAKKPRAPKAAKSE